MSKERIAEIELLIDELKLKATGLADESGFNVTYDVPAGILHKLLAWRDGASRLSTAGLVKIAEDRYKALPPSEDE